FFTGIAANGDANCSQPSAANLSNGTSGTGAVLLASAPSMSNAVVNQAANNNDVLSGKRATDSSPTGNFMHFTDFAALNDLFKVDVAGNVAANSFSGDGSGLTGISGANVSNIPNTALQHSSVTINTGSGLSGGGSLSLGGALTLSNTGVLSVASGNTGISIGGTASNPTVANTGVLSFNGSTGAVNGVSSVSSGNVGIAIGGTTADPTVSNAGVLSNVAGAGISVNNGGVGNVTITNNGVLAVGASGALSSSGGQTPSISLTGVVAVVNGGTGSTAQNFVDLSTAQSVAGNKTFTGSFLTGNATINQAANNTD